MVEDLLAVGDALDDAGIPFLLVRGNDERPLIAVDRTERKARCTRLRRRVRERAVLRHDPGPRARRRRRRRAPRRRAALGAPQAHRPAHLPAAHRTHRPPALRQRDRRAARVLAVRRRRDRGPDRERADAAHAARDPRRSRRRAPARPRLADARAHVRAARHRRRLRHRHGVLLGRRFERRVRARAREAHAELRRRRGRRLRSPLPADRRAQVRAALVHMFAPWVRRIFIATDSPAPSWLDEASQGHDRAQRGVLRRPVGAADAQLARRREPAAPHRRASPSTSCTRTTTCSSGARSRPTCSSPPAASRSSSRRRRASASASPHPERSGFENAARVNRALLRERFGKVTTRHLEHCAAPLRKSVMAELEAEFPEDFARTAASRFRSATDISVTNSLYHYYALLTGRAVVQTDAARQVRRDHAEARRCRRCGACSSAATRTCSA